MASLDHDPSIGGTPLGDMTQLVYELLDAHADTAELAADLVADLDWDLHLAYLLELQRVGREALAQVTAET